MYIAGLLSRDAKSEGWPRDLRICVFHQFPEDGTTAGPHTNFENHCTLSVTAQSREMAPRVATFESRSSSHQERLSLVPLPTSWDTRLPGPVGYHIYPKPSAMARHMTDNGHITVPREEDLADDSV